MTTKLNDILASSTSLFHTLGALENTVAFHTPIYAEPSPGTRKYNQCVVLAKKADKLAQAANRSHLDIIAQLKDTIREIGWAGEKRPVLTDLADYTNPHDPIRSAVTALRTISLAINVVNKEVLELDPYIAWGRANAPTFYIWHQTRPRGAKLSSAATVDPTNVRSFKRVGYLIDAIAIVDALTTMRTIAADLTSTDVRARLVNAAAFMVSSYLSGIKPQIFATPTNTVLAIALNADDPHSFYFRYTCRDEPGHEDIIDGQVPPIDVVIDPVLASTMTSA